MLLAVDTDYKFTNFDVSLYGSNADGSVFPILQLWEIFQQRLAHQTTQTDSRHTTQKPPVCLQRMLLGIRDYDLADALSRYSPEDIPGSH